MTLNKHFLFAILMLSSTFFVIVAEKGVVIVPVADLIGQPAGDNSHHFYSNLSWAPTGAIKDCPRLHQALFNEVVEILEYKKSEVHISVPNAYHQKNNFQPKQTEYWTLACNILPLSQVHKKNTNAIPKPIHHNKALEKNQSIATLVEPFWNSITKQTYSAGTRFVCVHKKNPAKTAVLIYDSNENRSAVSLVPNYKIITPETTDPESCIQLFISILRKWISTHKNFLPYVWGGCSLTNTLPVNTFSKETIQNKDDSISHYQRPLSTRTKTGFDCSSLILRAAQAAGIPYFFKNTSTAHNKLSSLTWKDTLKNGDLIWTQGHIMIIVDIKNHIIIEAGSYGNGYGIIHALPVNKIFKNISTVHELKHACLNKKDIHRLNASETVSTDYRDCKILKIRSLWDKKN